MSDQKSQALPAMPQAVPGHMRVAIIGGGSAGLVTLKTLLEYVKPEQGLEVVLFESYVHPFRKRVCPG
jgi:flavin-dependent dehydrogenase